MTISIESKQCSRCKLSKPNSEFHKSSRRKDGLKPSCKECVKEYYRESNGTLKMYNSHLLRTYGITREQYEELVTAQDGKCALCRVAFPKSRYHCHLDHCHETGIVRGIVCAKCNMRIDQYEDDPDLLLRYYEYIMRGRNEGSESPKLFTMV